MPITWKSEQKRKNKHRFDWLEISLLTLAIVLIVITGFQPSEYKKTSDLHPCREAFGSTFVYVMESPEVEYCEPITNYINK